MKHSITDLEIHFCKLWIISVFVLVTGCSSSKNLTHLLDNTLKYSPVFKNAFVGLAVFDPKTKETIYSHNSHKYFIPASTLKLLTYYSGIKVLGDSIPHLRYEVRGDTLFFTGTGDPSFLNPFLPASPALQFLQHVPQNLYFVPAQQIRPFGPGWAWDDYNASYSAEISGLPLYGNLVHFEISEEIGEMRVIPKLFRDSLRQKPVISPPRIHRKPWKNFFLIPPLKEKQSFEQLVPFRTSDFLVTKLLSDTLNRRIRLWPEKRKFHYTELSSAVLTDSLYSRMLQESDNFIAEQVLLMVSQKISDTLNTAIAIEHIQQHFLQDLPDPLVWVDGSGLSRYNLVTPRSMIRVLEKISEEVSYLELLELLPAGGKTGTLKERFTKDETFIFAKTGSLSNTHNLTGILVTRTGRKLLFSFMTNNNTAPPGEIRREMDRLLYGIRDDL